MLFVLPILLFFVWFTLLIHPTVESLSEPLIWNLADGLAWLGLPASHPLWGLHGFWFTAILAAVNVIFLVFWAFAKSVHLSKGPGGSAELRGVLVTVSQLLFFVTLTSVWFETQPFILRAMTEPFPDAATADAYGSSISLSDGLGASRPGWLARVTLYLAPGAVFAYFLVHLG